MTIRTRLTLWYTGLLALTLLLLGILIYSVVGRILIVNLQERLLAQAEDVISVVQQENDPVAVMRSGRVRLPSIDTFGSQYYTQIVQLDGRAVQLSENLRGQRLPESQDLLQDLEPGRPRFVTLPAGNIRLHIASLPIPIGNQIVGIVEVASLMSNIEDALLVVTAGAAARERAGAGLRGRGRQHPGAGRAAPDQDHHRDRAADHRDE